MPNTVFIHFGKWKYERIYELTCNIWYFFPNWRYLENEWSDFDQFDPNRCVFPILKVTKFWFVLVHWFSVYFRNKISKNENKGFWLFFFYPKFAVRFATSGGLKSENSSQILIKNYIWEFFDSLFKNLTPKFRKWNSIITFLVSENVGR